MPPDDGLAAWEPVRLPPPPPPCPRDCDIGPPSFVGVGVQRCGTTWWFDLLAAHPRVVVPPGIRKELHYFDRFYRGGFSLRDAAAYHAYFPRRQGEVIGEWTPSYVSDVGTPAMLAAAAPQARLLVLVRDPVERYRSALRRQDRVAARARLRMHSLSPLDAFARGLYQAQLQRLLRQFDRSSVLLLQYERCVLDPLGELCRTLAFLGLSAEDYDPQLDAWPNRQERKPAVDADLTAEIVRAYAPDVAALAAEWPEIDLGLWPSFARLR